MDRVWWYDVFFEKGEFYDFLKEKVQNIEPDIELSAELSIYRNFNCNEIFVDTKLADPNIRNLKYIYENYENIFNVELAFMKKGVWVIIYFIPNYENVLILTIHNIWGKRNEYQRGYHDTLRKLETTFVESGYEDEDIKNFLESFSLLKNVRIKHSILTDVEIVNSLISYGLKNTDGFFFVCR